LTTRLFLNAATALAYALFGWLSLKVSTPPDYVSLVFLPAGLALAVVLVWGAWLTPGVFLGSLLVQVLAHSQAGVASWSSALLLAPAGAALQAWATAWMVWRWVGYPSAMDTPIKVALFLFVVAPMGSMLNASLSVPLLVAGGAIPATDALYSWWTWWLGDALGVVLLAPMVLALFGEPAEAWRPRIRTVALPMVFALVLASGSFYQLRQSDERALHQRFQQETQEQALRLQRRLDAQTDSVVAIAKLMQLTAPLTEADFKAATRPWLERYRGTQNFGWSPVVMAEQRAAFETPPWRGGAGGLPIKGRDDQGKTFQAPPAPYHLPITLVEPMDSNRSVLGLDVRVLPATAASVADSQATGLPTATRAIRLVQEAREQRGVVMYQAVFASGSTTLKGVVSAVFRMDDVLHAVLDPADAGRWTLCLVDTQASPDNRRLSGPPGCAQQPITTHTWAAAWPLHFGGQRWTAHFVIGPQYLAQTRNWTTWVTLATGLGSVAMLGAFLMVITGLNRRTQRLVEQRTVELARSNATLAQLAHFDPLTGLSNRAHWITQAESTLREARERGESMAIMFLDLDRFKHVNDSLGHSQGDLLLQTVAQRLRVCLRARDVLARLGGDEFVVLLPKLKGRDGASVAARKIVTALSEPVVLDAHEVTVSASLGLAYYPGDGDDIETLLRHADTAMYAVKDSGRNSWRFFSPDMTERLSQRLVLETGLRRALQPEAQELFLEYQPQVNGEGLVLGTEALVRAMLKKSLLPV
jgi:diguanylate cyclase (GGDEF)-like protein